MTPHFDPHLTLNFNNTLSFVHGKLVRHKVGVGVTPGTFTVEPDLAERWEEPDDTTVVFHLRRGVRWRSKPPVNGRELTAEDVKFTYERFLTEKGNPLRFLDALKKSHPNLVYQDFLSNVTTGIYMRTDKPPFNDVRVRRAISHALDRRAIIDAVFLRGEPSPGISRGLPEWSPRIDQLGPGAQYYRHDPKEARRLLAEAGYPQGLKTTLTVTPGYGSDLVDSFQLPQRQLKEGGIEAELKLQEYGAYISTTFLGKYEGMAMGPFSIAWEPHTSLYGMYMPDQSRNSGHVNDPRITGMLKEQMGVKDLETRRKLIFDIQRYAAEQQYYVYLYSAGLTGSWRPSVKNYAPNSSFDYGNKAAALWLDR